MAPLLSEAEHRAIELLTRHRPALDELTALLLEHETVDGEPVYRIVAAHGEAPEPAAPPVGVGSGAAGARL